MADPSATFKTSARSTVTGRLDPEGTNVLRPPVLDEGGSIERDEHLSDVLRLRKAAVIGLFAWILFTLVDVLVFTWIEPGPPWLFLGLRALGLVAIGGTLLRLNLTPLPSPRALRVLDVGTYTGAIVLITVSCLHFKGIESPYALGVVTTLVLRGSTMAEPWRRGAVPIFTMALAHPATLLVMAGVDPTIAAQFQQPASVAAFVHNQCFILGAASMILAGGHVVWSLRRKVLEARAVGRYQLEERIAEGGMGEVWRAHHAGLKADVAVKILRQEKLGPNAVARFEREARVTTRLTHPNTVRVFDYGVSDDGLLYYAMELLEGEDLLQHVRRQGPMHPKRAFHATLQAARALGEAHAMGVVHRDVKPDNLFLTEMGGQEDFVKVLDFGVATMIGGGAPSLTQEGFGIGTPSYFPPELIMSKPVDARADVYSLGCVLYFLLTGRPPFVEKDVRALLLAHLRKQPKPPSERIARRLPRDVEAVVMKCLAKNPDDRYPDGNAVADAIQACIERRRARILSAVEEPMALPGARAEEIEAATDDMPTPQPSRPSDPRVEHVAPSMYRVHQSPDDYEENVRTSLHSRTTPEPVPLVTRRDSLPPDHFDEAEPTDVEARQQHEQRKPILDAPSRRMLRRVAG